MEVMDIEEEISQITKEAPGGQQPRGGVLTVSKHEWEQIEQVPPHTRAVGALFQSAARELQGGGEGPRTKKNLVFDAKAYSALVGTPASLPDPKKACKGKAADVKQKLLEATQKQDRDRAFSGAKSTFPPRKEAFGTRCESFVHATIIWLQNLPMVSRSIAARKFQRWLHENVEGTPEGVMSQLDGMEAGDGDSLAALDIVCNAEEVLACEVWSELRLRKEQGEMVRAVRDAHISKKALLLKYKTPPSGGKSSASALLGAALTDVKDCYVVYACYSRPVRIDVCKHLVATCVPFAIVVQGIASPSFTCYFGKPKKPHAPPPPDLPSRIPYSLRLCRACDRPPIVLVCDLLSTILFLQARSQDILLFDEPTADVASTMSADVRSILRSCPRITVLMSATVPDFDRISAFVTNFEERYPGAEVLAVNNERLSISVSALTSEGRIIAPHEFGASLQEIRSSGHLRRFYSPKVLRALMPTQEELSYADVLDYEGIRTACLRILEGRATRRGLQTAIGHPPVDLKSICSAHAHYLAGTTLVVTDHQTFVSDSVEANLEGMTSLRRMLKSNEASRKPEKKDSEKAAKREGTRAEEDAREGWDDDARHILALRYVINSRQHVLRFAGSLEEFPEKMQRAAMLIPEEVLESSNERIVEAALCGVLFFNNEYGDAAFEATAQTLAEKAVESYVVGDISLVYGLNLPFDRLIVAHDGLSRTELVQLCGRVGRTCRASSRSEIIFLDLEVARAAMTLGPYDASALKLFDVALPSSS
jgi:hypothetical protein